MNDQLVSAIITTHNRDPVIVLRAVNSVLNQTYKKIELIVVDDSDENYPHRIEVEETVRKASEKITYIQHDTCQGACAARNTGLSYSNGHYVAFLDDDDEWMPEKIERQVEGFADHSIAMVYCGVIIINEKWKTGYIGHAVYKKGYVFESLLKRNFIGNTSNPLIKKECIDKVGRFDTKMQSAQDYDLWLRIAIRYPINYIPMPLLYFHVHNNDRISTNIDNRIAGLKRINSKYCEDITKDDKTWYMRYRVLIPLYVKKGWKKKAFTLWIRCVKRSPFSFLDNLLYLLIIISDASPFLYKTYDRQRLLLITRYRQGKRSG